MVEDFDVVEVRCETVVACVCVDVLKCYSVDGMPFYTLHKCKDAHHYVYVDVL
jgi:hypothetical protein